jgi:hypothetical protein
MAIYLYPQLLYLFERVDDCVRIACQGALRDLQY